MQYYEHQKRIFAENPNRILLCWDTGTGKSLAGIQLAVQNCENNFIVICPKGIKEKWKREIEAHGTTKKYMVFSKEEFKKYAPTLPQTDGVIVDEAHYFAGMKSQLSKALRMYVKKHNIQNVWLLTATPYMSTPWNIFTLAGHIGHNWDYMKFKYTFFNEIKLGKSTRTIPVVKSGIEKDIADLVKKIGSVIHIEECADVPEQVFETEFIDIHPSQEKGIKKLYENEVNPIVRYTKTHQILNGTLKSDGYSDNEIFDNNKFDRLVEIIDVNNKVAIFCRYNLQIEMYKELLVGKGYEVFVINGETQDKDLIVRLVEKSEKCVVLINAACSEGYELPSIGVCVFASLSFSYKDYKQACGRFLRINRLKKNVYIHLVIPNSIDEAVYNNIMKKQDFNIEIYTKNEAEKSVFKVTTG